MAASLTAGPVRCRPRHPATAAAACLPASRSRHSAIRASSPDGICADLGRSNAGGQQQSGQRIGRVHHTGLPLPPPRSPRPRRQSEPWNRGFPAWQPPITQPYVASKSRAFKDAATNARVGRQVVKEKTLCVLLQRRAFVAAHRRVNVTRHGPAGMRRVVISRHADIPGTYSPVTRNPTTSG